MGERRPIELDEGWGRMEEGIGKLKQLLDDNGTSEQFTPAQYINLYTTIYNMCTQKPPHDYSAQLYSRYGEAFHTYIEQVVNRKLSACNSPDALLKELHKRWGNHKIMVRWLSRFFNYLDRYYIIRHQLKSLADVGLIRFRDEVYNQIRGQTRNAILSCVEKERQDMPTDRALLKNVLGIFQEVGMGNLDCYEKDFEEDLITATNEWYQRQAAAWIETDSCPEFLVKAEQALTAEEDRVTAYLHTNTRRKLLAAVETELLAKYEARLLEKEDSGCAALLRDNKTEDLARMYRLFSREGIPQGLEPLAAAFKRHVDAEGSRFNHEATEAVAARKEAAAGKPSKDAGSSLEMQFVRNLIALHDKYQDYVVTCFQNSSTFHKALKEAFENCCNKAMAGVSFSEHLSSFANELLCKGGSEKLGEAEVEQLLDKVVVLLTYIQEKDMFSEFYRKRLARRLLNDRSVGSDQESQLISRFKQQNGQAFTSKMEGMVQDVSLVLERQQRFEEFCRETAGTPEGSSESPVINVTVLTTGLWPTFKVVGLTLPAEMTRDQERFQNFYYKAQGNRKLTWLYSLGTCTVKGNFDNKPVELAIAPMQAAVLLSFNKAETLTYETLAAELSMGNDDLNKVLHSFCFLKYKILLKSPENKVIAPTDSFTFNSKFTDKMRRIKIPLASQQDDRKKVEETVLGDRVPLVEAAIVRIMKARRTLPHTELSGTVMDQLKGTFHPDARFIKKCIEGLIGRDFLAREEGNSSIYKYLA